MKEKLSSNSEILIFDMDGTLYELDGKNNGFKGSLLETTVKENAIRFISKKNLSVTESAKEIFEKALLNPKGISSFLSERYGISRNNYFDIVWNINPEGIVKNFETPVKTIKKFAENGNRLILLTSAPSVWQIKVIEYLGLSKLFESVFTGENFLDKGEVFKLLSLKYNSQNLISIGDQEKTDIIPAKNFGIRGVLIDSPKKIEMLLDFLKQ